MNSSMIHKEMKVSSLHYIRDEGTTCITDDSLEMKYLLLSQFNVPCVSQGIINGDKLR